MILRAIRVQGWRCFADPVEVGPFDDGLNVIYAPNATGKSTLFEALLRGLLDGHRVTGREVEALRPWGRDLAPSVTVEFAHDGTDYRLTKRFLDRPASELARREGGRFVRLAEGDAADDRARELLTRNPPGRGLARPENRGLAQVLWVPQGELTLSGLSDDVVAGIRESLGAQISGPGSGPLERAIEEAYLAIYTPTGQLKRGKDAPRLARLREGLAQARTTRADAQTQYEAFDQASRRVEDLRAKRVQAKREVEELAKTLAEARKQADSFRVLQSEKRTREEQVKAAEAAHARLRQQMDQIRAVRSELGNVREALARMLERTPPVAREVGERETAAARAQGILEDARRARAEAEKTRRTAEDARRFLDGNAKAQGESALLVRIAEAAGALDERRKERAAVLAPDDKTMRAVRRAAAKRDEARVRIEAARITLEIVPEGPGSAEVIAGEEPGTRPLAPGRPLTVRGTPEVVVDMPGVARLRARGPVSSADEIALEYAAAERRIEELTRGLGTSDLDALESLREQARDLDARVTEAKAHLETLLVGRSFEEIEAGLRREQAVLEEILERNPQWRRTLPDAVALRDAADAVGIETNAAIENAEVEWQAAQTALSAARERLAALEAEAAGGSRQVEKLQSRLDELTSDGKTDEQRQAEMRQEAMAWEAARAGLADVEAKLSALGGDPTLAADKLERQLEAIKDDATRALEEEKNEEGRLQHLCAAGPYSALAGAEEEVAHLEDEVAREELRASAVRLLRDTVLQCRSEALTAIAGPVEAAATRYLQRIAGGGLGRVQIGQALEPEGVRPATADSHVAMGSLSGGEKEQIHLVTRLALADVLARDGRQLVVLDDVLTATDAGRLARVLPILEEAARRLQILVLTCHPERYRGLDGARFLDLDAIRREATSNS